MSSIPQTSVVLPAYNRLEYLRDAVASVLAQTYEDWELLVADDGSGVEMTSYLAQLERVTRVKVLRLAHSGNPSVVRNAACRAARGRYVAFLDSDDVWLPAKLEKQMRLHQSCPQRRWSYAAMQRIHAGGAFMYGEPLRPTPGGAIFEDLLTLTADISTSSVVVDRTLLEEVGYFDETQRYFEDFDLYFRLSLRSNASVVTEPLVRIRNHAQHYSANRVGMCEGRARLLDKMQPFAEQKGLSGVWSRERTQNNADLVRALAAAGRRHEALRLLWRIRGAATDERKWWRALLVLLRSLAPDWVRTACRRMRRGAATTR